jgi:hypothetical protein
MHLEQAHELGQLASLCRGVAVGTVHSGPMSL